MTTQRPPKVHLSYEVAHEDGSFELKELPFIVGVLADLSGHPKQPLPEPFDGRFLAIERDNFDAVLAGVKPRLGLRVANVLQNNGSELAVELVFETLADFGPALVAGQVEPLARMLAIRTQLRELLGRLEAHGRPEPDLDALLAGMFERAHLARLMASVAAADADTRRARSNAFHRVEASIAGLDELLSRQLDLILHHPDFQRLEASWRGLHELVKWTDPCVSLQIRVLDITKQALSTDLRTGELAESFLWRSVHGEIDRVGGEPYGALIGDFVFDKIAEDVELLSRLSRVAAAVHAPFVTAPAPQMFDMDSFTEMPAPRDLANIFDKNNAENTKWLSFRDDEYSRYVVMVLPRVLRRLPYSVMKNPIEAFNFVEETRDHDDFCWGNAAYEYGLKLTEAFAKHHWCMAIRGPDGGGLVANLPIHTYTTADGDVAAKCPTEVRFSAYREFELSDLGFIGLLHCMNTDYAVFFGERSANRPKRYSTEKATANARFSAQIPYLMAMSRFAHYLMVICRERFGAFMSREDCETLLYGWLVHFVLDDPDATQEAKAKRPLREARIEVIEDKARPGCYQAIAFLRPHFQLDPGVALRLVVELPPQCGI